MSDTQTKRRSLSDPNKYASPLPSPTSPSSSSSTNLNELRNRPVPPPPTFKENRRCKLKGSPGDKIEAYKTLEVYLSNALKSTENPKFKKINTNNINYHAFIKSVKGAEDFLLQSGFEKISPSELELNTTALSTISKTLQGIKKSIQKLQNEIASLPTLPISFIEEAQSLSGVKMTPSSRYPVGYSSTKGQREYMEDELIVLGNLRGREDTDYFAVFDGHTGKDAVQFVSKKLHQEIWKRLLIEESQKSVPLPPDTVYKVLKDSFSSTDKSLPKTISGCTAVISLIIENKLFVANAGDSRAVLFTSSRYQRLSVDHKPEDQSEKSRVESTEGGEVKLIEGVWRVQGVLGVSRSFGDSHLKKWVISEPSMTMVDLTDLNKSEKAFLVMGCDGLWDVVTEQHILKIIQEITNETKNFSVEEKKGWREKRKEKKTQKNEQKEMRKAIRTSAKMAKKAGVKINPNLSSAVQSSSTPAVIERTNEPVCLQIARKLKNTAVEKDSCDNISVLVIELM